MLRAAHRRRRPRPRSSVGLPKTVHSFLAGAMSSQGRIGFRFADREETYESGEAYYVGPGHTPVHYAGTEIVEFSPTALLDETIPVVLGTSTPTGSPSMLRSWMNYRVAYAIGFHPWEDLAGHPPFADKLLELVARDENGHGPPYGRALDLGTGSAVWGVQLASAAGT